jgi:hypothetical protein
VCSYIEWEDYPEKKEKAHKILISQEFPPPPEFQLGPIPGTNPVLEGRAASLNHIWATLTLLVRREMEALAQSNRRCLD